ncbi:MAG: V-type ATP synthase subunit E [Oscillospiraceae bacterium]|nr:V-type ATP synthase subunit E [Oscillospiraceae bacterium]
MPTDARKADKFLKAINKYAEKQRDKIRSENKNYKKFELEKAKREILKDSYFFIKKEMATMRRAIASEIFKKEIEGRKKLFAKRNSIAENVFVKSERALKDFTKTEKYHSLLKNFVKNIFDLINEGETVLLVREEDFKFVEEISGTFKKSFVIEKTKEIKIGGIKAVNTKMGIILDETLDTKLENQYEWFIANCNMKVDVECD